MDVRVTPSSQTAWDHRALPYGVLPLYSTAAAHLRVRQLYVRLVVDRPPGILEGRSAYLALADGYEHALALCGLRRDVRYRVTMPCEGCGASIPTALLEQGRWLCSHCSVAEPSRLALAVARYVFAVRIGLRGEHLKKRRTNVVRLLELAGRYSRHPSWGSQLDLAVAVGILQRPLPPRVPHASPRVPRAFPWRRLDYSSGPWRRFMGIRVYVAICEIGLHPAAVKAELLAVAPRPLASRQAPR